MRLSITALVAAVALSAAAGAHAAPTCVDHNDIVRRCGTPGAMPVGWTPPPGTERPMDAPMDPSLAFGLVCILGGVFALIALMPDFDGDWGSPPADDDD